MADNNGNDDRQGVPGPEGDDIQQGVPGFEGDYVHLGGADRGGQDVQERAPNARARFYKRYKLYLVCYALSAVIVIACAVSIVILAVYPKADNLHIQVYQGDFALVALLSPWISSLTMSAKDNTCEENPGTGKSCNGDVFFNIPCDDLVKMRSHNSSYNPRDFKHLSDNGIYVLGNSTFHVQLTEPGDSTTIYVLAVDDYCLYEEVVYGFSNNLLENCRTGSSLPGDSVCHVWNESQSLSVSLPTPPTLLPYNGSHYHVFTQPSKKFTYTIDRYYYETSKFKNYSHTVGTSDITLKPDFDPWNAFASSTCVLLDTTTCEAFTSAGILDVVLMRSYDILALSAIPAVITLLVTVVVAFGHLHNCRNERPDYVPLEHP